MRDYPLKRYALLILIVSNTGCQMTQKVWSGVKQSFDPTIARGVNSMSPQQRYESDYEAGLPVSPEQYGINEQAWDNERVWGNMHKIGASNFYMSNGGKAAWELKRVYDPTTRKFRNYRNEFEYLNR
jgi:hypothetical protein